MQHAQLGGQFADLDVIAAHGCGRVRRAHDPGDDRVEDAVLRLGMRDEVMLEEIERFPDRLKRRCITLAGTVGGGAQLIDVREQLIVLVPQRLGNDRHWTLLSLGRQHGPPACRQPSTQT